MKPLYKKTATGAIQMWLISTEGSTIVTRFGQVGGAIQEARDTVKVGKGKKTPVEQAKAEAESQWRKKKTAKGYVESIAAAEAGEVDDLVEGGYSPMLAHRYDQRGDDIVFPAYVQPKFDGHRCVVGPDGGLWSRTRKRIRSMPHIAEAVRGLVGLDGELYIHRVHSPGKDVQIPEGHLRISGAEVDFEFLTSLIRASEPRPGHEAMQYHVYDVNMPGTFEQRNFWLEQNLPRSGPLKLVETRLVENEDEMMLAFENFLSGGYEGLMVRNALGLYTGKRSADLQKVKKFIDSEFTVVGVEEGRGKLVGHAIFVCQAPGGVLRAKMKGPLEDLKGYWERPERAIGKELTVKYQGLSKYGIPRFPVAWRFK